MGDAAMIELPTDAPPKKPPKRQRRHVDHFRTDDEEHAELAARAQAAGLSVDAFCRLQTLGAAGPRSKRATPTADLRQRAQMLAALNHIGGNLNQGIRAVHDIRQTAPAAVDRDRLAYELEALRKLFETEVDALIPALEAVRDAFSGGFADDRQG